MKTLHTVAFAIALLTLFASCQTTSVQAKGLSNKETEKYRPMYFFSTDAAAAPQALTKDNLKAAYPDNHKFHDELDAQFKTDADLASYDSFHKMYKPNHILQMSPM